MKIFIKKYYKTILMYLIITTITLVALFPLYWTLVSSLMKRGSLLNITGIFLRLKDISLESYAYILSTKPVLVWLMNSAIMVVFTTFIGMTVSIMAAYSLSRSKSKSTDNMGIALLTARIMPETLLIIPLYVIFSKIGLLNNIMSVVITNVTFMIPFAVWMLKGFFDGIPVELEEAAYIEGYSLVGTIIKVVLPLTKPGLAATGMYVAILAWSEFIFSSRFLLQPSRWTVTVGVTSLVGEHIIMWNDIMAAAVLSIIPVSLLFIFLQKYLISGMTDGAVKQ